MSVRKVGPPTALPVTVAEVKQKSRVQTDTEDALIEGLIAAATAHAEKYCGQTFSEKLYEVTLDAFPTLEISLPRGPVMSVVSVTYRDENGDEQLVDAESYYVDIASPDGWIVPVADFSWPTPIAAVNAVAIRYVAGPEVIEADVKRAILALCGHWYNNREIASDKQQYEIPAGWAAILFPNRRMFA